jgi:hypothetical protein
MELNWYQISIGYFGFPQPENKFGYLHQTYNSKNACPTCHIGLVQQDEFQFKSEPKAKHSHFLGLNWVFDEVFVRERVKDVFENNNIQGLDFSRPLLYKLGIPVPDLFQCRVNNTVSKGLVTEHLKQEVCELTKDEKQLQFLKAIQSKLVEGPFCGKVKYNLPQGDIALVIQKEFLPTHLDFVRLDYPFGSGGNTQRLILVSERVKVLIEQEKWRGAFLKKVSLV